MRELTFPLISLGSSAMENPDASEIALWIHENKGAVADLTTYQLDRLFSFQKGCVAEPAAGGDFYGVRIAEALGSCDGVVEEEYLLDSRGLKEDLHFLPKKTVFSLPSFTQLELVDKYYKEDDEFLDGGTLAYLKVCRELLDKNVPRIIVYSDHPSDIELERVHGKHYLWWVPAEYYETLLEISHNLVLAGDDISHLGVLADSYEIRNIYLRDASKETITEALELFDKECLFVAGYAPGNNQESYWKQLSNIKCRV